MLSWRVLRPRRAREATLLRLQSLPRAPKTVHPPLSLQRASMTTVIIITINNSIHKHVNTYICIKNQSIYVYICMCVYRCVHIYTYKYSYTCVGIYTYTYIHMYGYGNHLSVCYIKDSPACWWSWVSGRSRRCRGQLLRETSSALACYSLDRVEGCCSLCPN